MIQDSHLHRIPKQALKLCIIILSLLVISHILAVSYWYSDLSTSEDWYYLSLFDLDEEESIGTWFNCISLLIAGQVLILITWLKHKSKDKHYWSWLGLSLGFVVLSIDEIAGFHELVNTIVTIIHWTYIGLFIVITLAILYSKFLWSLPKRTRFLFIISGSIFIGGAIIVEWSTIHYETNDQLDTLAYSLWNTLEEGMEILGVNLFIYALLDYIIKSKLLSEFTIQVPRVS